MLKQLTQSIPPSAFANSLLPLLTGICLCQRPGPQGESQDPSIATQQWPGAIVMSK